MLCRICLDDNDVQSVFDPNISNGLILRDFIEHIFEVNIIITDKITTGLCKPCRVMFTNLLEYKEASQLHDSLLKIQYHFELTNGKKGGNKDIKNEVEPNEIELKELEKNNETLRKINLALEGISKDGPLEFRMADSDIKRKTKYDYNLIKNIFTHIFDRPNHLDNVQTSNIHNVSINNCSKYLKDVDGNVPDRPQNSVTNVCEDLDPGNCHPLKRLISSLNHKDDNLPSKENNLSEPKQETFPARTIQNSPSDSSGKSCRKRKMYTNKSTAKKPFVLEKNSFFVNYILKKPIELTPMSDCSMQSAVDSEATSSKSNLIETGLSDKNPISPEIQEKFDQIDDIKHISTSDGRNLNNENLKCEQVNIKLLNESPNNEEILTHKDTSVEDKRNFECFSTIKSENLPNDPIFSQIAESDGQLLGPKSEKSTSSVADAVPPYLKNEATDSCKESTGAAEISLCATSSSIVNVAIMSDNAIDNAENLIQTNNAEHLVQTNLKVQNVSGDRKVISESSSSNSNMEIDPSTMSLSEDDSNSISSLPYPLERKSFYKFVYIRRFPKVEDLNEKPKIITKVLCKCKTIFSSEVKCLQHIERGCPYQIGRMIH